MKRKVGKAVKVSAQKDENSAPKKKKLKTSSPSSSIEVVDIRYLRYSINEKFPTERHLFLKKNPSEPNMLIVSNFPAFLDKEIVVSFLSQFVKFPITDCDIQRSNSLDGSLDNGQLTLAVYFEDEKGVDQAFELCQSVGPYVASSFGEVQMKSVFRRSIDKYKGMFSTPEQIQAAAEEYILQQDEAVKLARKEAKRKSTVPDDEGWVTVTRGSKMKAAPQVRMKKNEIPLTGGLNKKKKNVELAFYSFQNKESKAKKMRELREKFEEDKKRIAQLKFARKFKPV